MLFSYNSFQNLLRADGVCNRVLFTSTILDLSERAYYLSYMHNHLLYLVVPEFDVTPQTQIVTVGSNVTFSCNASGVPPPVISWFFNGKPIIASSIRIVRRDILRIFLVQNTDAYEGQYTCSATSRAGTANYTATLAVDGT